MKEVFQSMGKLDAHNLGELQPSLLLKESVKNLVLRSGSRLGIQLDLRM